ncbi:carbon-nitrogen hydrolase family protein [Nitrogeniibacter mangrovi]|uniref:Carbon-nitrogen hydrolase family protein n=1 Tax=Nitrogeniibacter mangrovi TaxID=2016596 RepID=A0A6C1B8M7_9RHOO|nr:carbon-nitrogen hydrolase family protein [Nitrogeniibacter mangrovi]QID18700.1 carbon-nitrogen hydrolase family protein [Nitrogeniibacter mangrovi]
MSENDPLRIAAIQMISVADVVANLSVAGELIADAAARGASLVALPEYFALMSGDEQAKVRARERDGDGPIQQFLSDTARRHGIWLIGGTVPLVAQADDKVRNACLAYGPDGVRVARYDKIHLFGFDNGQERYAESETIEAGDDVVTFEAGCGRVGLSVCYDLRFPELFRAMGVVDLIVLPAAFTYTTGQAHWDVLLRARAIENQCYVMAPAQGGRHPWGRRTYGDTLIVDPWGKVLERCAEGPGVVSAQIDPDLVAQVRARLPALRHRRFV